MTEQGKCSFLAGCPMFAKLRLDSTKRILMEKYCLGDYTKCKRYQMRISERTPPDNMLPDGTVIGAK